MAGTQYRVRYEGPPALVGLLAEILQREGAEVRVEGRLAESRGMSDALMGLASGTTSSLFVYVLTRPSGEVPAILEAAVRKFQSRSPGGTVRLENQAGREIRVWTANRPPT